MTPQQLIMFMRRNATPPDDDSRQYNAGQRTNEFVPFEDQTRLMQWLYRNSGAMSEWDERRELGDYRADASRDYNSGQRTGVDPDPWWDTRRKDPYYFPNMDPNAFGETPPIGSQGRDYIEPGLFESIRRAFPQEQEAEGRMPVTGLTSPEEPEPNIMEINVADLPWYLPPEMYLKQQTHPMSLNEANQQLSNQDQARYSADVFTRNEPAPATTSNVKRINLGGEGTITPGLYAGRQSPPSITIPNLNPGINIFRASANMKKPGALKQAASNRVKGLGRAISS